MISHLNHLHNSRILNVLISVFVVVLDEIFSEFGHTKKQVQDSLFDSKWQD